MRKFLYPSLMLFVSTISKAQTSVYECTPANSAFTQGQLINNDELIEQNCFLLDNPTNYHFVSNKKKTLDAVNEIHLKTDFHGKPLDNGFLHLKAGNKADFDVVCMNYTDLTQVLKLKKFELGITLPNGVQEKVDNFINDALVGDDQRLNPYMDWDIRVIAEFTNPGLPWTLSVDGFYNQEFTDWMTNDSPLPNTPPGESLESYPFNNWQGHYNSLGGYNQVATSFPFLFRFAPPINGKWTCKVKIVLANETYEADPFNFTVIESGSLGYLKVGDERRYFKLGDRGFYPVGANALWPFTSSEIKNNYGYRDEELINILPQVYDEEKDIYKTLTEEHLQVKPIPRIYDNHRNLIRNMADGGANMIKLNMNSFSQEIEWERLGNYTSRLYQAQELDETLELCEEKGLLISWNLQYQGTLIPKTCKNNGYYTSWGGDWGYYGTEYCYKKLIKQNNPADSSDFSFSNNPIHFFTDEIAKGYYKQRIRYFLARYGYSTNIGIFELFSEINTKMIFDQTELSDCEFNEISSANYEIIEAWHAEMAAYIKSHYNGAIHLVAPVYIDDKKSNDATFKNENVDLITKNIYPGLKCFAKEWINEIQKDILNQEYSANIMNYTSECHNDMGHQNCSHFEKPFYLPEFDPTEERCDDLQIEVKRSLWQIPFSGAASGFNWHSYQNGIVFQEYAKLSQFLGNLEGKTGWHPGAMLKATDGRWIFNQDWANDMDRKSKKSDLMYLRSGDKNYAIGVITNKTYNIQTGYSNPCQILPDDYDHLMSTDFVDTRDEDLFLNGLNNGKYYITYFMPDNQSTPYISDDQNGPRIKIKTLIPATDHQYIVLFMARKKNHYWLPEQEDSITKVMNEKLVELAKTLNYKTDSSTSLDFEQNSAFKIYPNPTNNHLKVEIKGLNGELFCKILSLDGKELKKTELDENGAKFDLNSFESGIYQIQIFENGIQVHHRKIIKL